MAKTSSPAAKSSPASAGSPATPQSNASSPAAAWGAVAVEFEVPQGPSAQRPCPDLVQQLVKATQLELKEAMAKAPAHFRPADPAHLWMHPPLDIRSPTEAASAGLSSYKAPWTQEACKNAIMTTGLYEAGGNVLWAEAFPRGEADQKLAGDSVTWAEVEDAADQFFSHRALVAAGKGVKPPAAARGQPETPRLVFPAPLAAWIDDRTKVIGHEGFQGSLALLSGHLYVAAWHLGMRRALRSDAASGWQWVAALWQCGLTVTFVLHECQIRGQAAAVSIQESEKRASLGACQDTFPAFAMKALLVLEDATAARPDVTNRMAFLEIRGVRFRGASVNRTMMTAILAFKDKFNAASFDLINKIAAHSGRDVLANGYAKLMRIGQVCNKEAANVQASCAELVQYFLESLDWSLRFEVTQPVDVTSDWLDKTGPTIGAVAVTLARRQTVEHVGVLVEDLRKTATGESIARSELDPVLAAFVSYPAYERAFPQAVAAAHDDEGGSADVDVGDPAEAMKKKYANAISARIIDFLYDVLGGVYDDKFKDNWEALGGVAGMKFSEVEKKASSP